MLTEDSLKKVFKGLNISRVRVIEERFTERTKTSYFVHMNPAMLGQLYSVQLETSSHQDMSGTTTRKNYVSDKENCRVRLSVIRWYT